VIGILGHLISAVVFLGIPIALIGIARFAVRNLAAPEYVQVPVLAKLTVTAGMMLGAALLSALARPELYAVEQVLKVDGPWDLSVAEFLSTRVNPFALNGGELADSLSAEGPSSLPVVLLGGAATLAIVAIILGFAYWLPPQALIAAAVSIFSVVVVAYVLFYLVCGALWLANAFNFWVLLIILALYQGRRRAL